MRSVLASSYFFQLQQCQSFLNLRDDGSSADIRVAAEARAGCVGYSSSEQIQQLSFRFQFAFWEGFPRRHGADPDDGGIGTDGCRCGYS